MFDNPFSFEGRIRRTEYLISLLITILVLYILISSTIDLASIAQKDEEIAMAIIGYTLSFWFIFSAGAKRCHDLGYDGWWQFTLKNLVQLLIQEGQVGNNSYGINPKDFHAVNHFTSRAPLSNLSDTISRKSHLNTFDEKSKTNKSFDISSTIDSYWDQINLSNFYKLTKTIYKYLSTSPSQRRFEREKKQRELEILKDPTKSPQYIEVEVYNENTKKWDTYWHTSYLEDFSNFTLKE